MFKGVNYVGVGVSDMDKSLRFYSDCLDFSEVMFDYTGSLPGMEKITSKPDTQARVVMLKNKNGGSQGLGMVKLVELLPPDKAGPMPEGMGWGEVGVSEMCLSVHGLAEKFYEVVVEKNNKALMPPIVCPLPPNNITCELAYVADPDGGKVELIDWKEIGRGLHQEPTIEGLNHVAFGVTDLEKSLEFYKELGFTEMVFEFDGYFDAMAIWFKEKLAKMKMSMMANYYGGAVEFVEQTPPSADLRGEWGHVGPMEFAIEVSNIETAYKDLQKKGYEFCSPPQTIEVPNGQWKYAYIIEPDNLYVSLLEARY